MVKTVYKNAKCGKQIAGYGTEDLKSNLQNHEEWCGICNGLKQETIKNTVDPKTTLKEFPKVANDLNGDGVFDAKDASIAGKVMASARKLKNSRKGKKRK